MSKDGFLSIKKQTNKKLQKKAKVTKSEGCSLEVLVRKQPELCSEIRVGKAQVPGEKTKTKLDWLEWKVDVSNHDMKIGIRK